MKCIIQPIKGEGWLPRLYSNKHEAQWNVMHIYIRQGNKVVKPKNIKSNRKQELSTSAILSIFNSATLIFFSMQNTLIPKFSEFKLRREKNLENFQPEGLFCARNTNNWKWGVYWEVLNIMKWSFLVLLCSLECQWYLAHHSSISWRFFLCTGLNSLTMWHEL